MDNDNIQRFMKVESAKAFQKRLRKGLKVYALVEYNYLLHGGSTNNEKGLPEALRKYIDVFSSQNTKKLTLNRESIDLAIEIQKE